MTRKLRRQLEQDKRRIARRLKAAEGGRPPRGGGPEFRAGRIRYEISERVRAMPYGGLGALHQVVKSIGLVSCIDRHL